MSTIQSKMLNHSRESQISRILHKVDRLLSAEGGKETSALERCWRFLNSTFVVTMIGGLALAYLSASWQANQAKNELVQQEAYAASKRRESLLFEFSTEIPYSLHLAREYKSREFWLAANKSNPVEARYPDSRTFAETRDHFESKKNEYLHRKSAAVYATQIELVFDGTPAPVLAAELANQIEKIEDATGDAGNAEIRLALARSIDLHNQLVRIMTKSVTRGVVSDEE